MDSLLGPRDPNSINIRRDVQDAFYRYKMPRLQSKIEGKGNGIKTVVPNMVEIAKALGRPPSYITKFFGAELGALSTCDEKQTKYIVNGAHDAEKLQNLLDVFIQKFVLCPNCDNPETNLSVSKKDGTIYRTCQACGHRATVDMLHKLVSFIRANPPPKPVKKTQAKDRAEQATDMANKYSSPLSKGDGSLAPEESIEGMIAPEDFDDSLVNVGTRPEDEEDWDEEAAAVHRQDELADLSETVKKKLAIKENPGNTLLDSLELFGEFLESNPTIGNEKILTEIKERDISADKAVVVIIQVLFVNDFLSTIKVRLPLLKKLVPEEKEQKALLGSVERLVGVVNRKLMENVPLILQTFYNTDLVDEDTLLSWRDKVSKRYVSKEVGLEVRKAAEPFFEWLENAESDEEEEESDDE